MLDLCILNKLSDDTELTGFPEGFFCRKDVKWKRLQVRYVTRDDIPLNLKQS